MMFMGKSAGNHTVPIKSGAFLPFFSRIQWGFGTFFPLEAPSHGNFSRRSLPERMLVGQEIQA
jgi:hypothetical protein